MGYQYRGNIISTLSDLEDRIGVILDDNDIKYSVFTPPFPVDGILNITFHFESFRQIQKILIAISAIAPMMPVTHKLDVKFDMTGDITEDEFLEWLGMVTEKYSILNVAKTNERVKYLCEKYKLLLG